MEKNPTIVGFPVKNLELRDCTLHRLLPHLAHCAFSRGI